jgi:hypothetical protein
MIAVQAEKNEAAVRTRSTDSEQTEHFFDRF